MGEFLTRRSLIFSGDSSVSFLDEDLLPLGRNQVLVRTMASAISSGTEKLVFTGKVPRGMAVDATLASLPGRFAYPLKYGYAAVGRVAATGELVDPSWLGRLVFAFNPHETAFTAAPGDLLPVPGLLKPETALFFPNLETAAGFLMDGRPMIGENVALFGQGVVGLLTLSLLRRFPLTALVTVDTSPARRERSRQLGATASLDPAETGFIQEFHRKIPAGADLTFEISGSPAALNQAIAVTGFAGRVIVGSWYGTRPATLDLGSHFHRSRIQIVSSQVSSLPPDVTGRWDRQRRHDLAWDLLEEINPVDLITHRIPFENAEEAYRIVSSDPEGALQVILTYPEAE
ncbi:MAG TPA: zinc-binding alcohol dehydrogenase [Anaerolineales bacterium]|nr:zinc-binding alcohol dehydrogenase [Anaerolineales bacterium]